VTIRDAGGALKKPELFLRRQTAEGLLKKDVHLSKQPCMT
jgi:hypothetical protein